MTSGLTNIYEHVSPSAVEREVGQKQAGAVRENGGKRGFILRPPSLTVARTLRVSFTSIMGVTSIIYRGFTYHRLSQHCEPVTMQP